MKYSSRKLNIPEIDITMIEYYKTVYLDLTIKNKYLQIIENYPLL